MQPTIITPTVSKEKVFSTLFTWHRLDAYAITRSMERKRFAVPDGCPPAVRYPCQWRYRIVSRDPEAIHRLVATYAHDTPYSLSRCGPNRLLLEMTVYSDYYRIHLQELLEADPAVEEVR